MFVGTLTRVGILLSSVVFPALAQTRIPVRLSHPKAEVFVFQPDKVTAKPGDVIEFTVESGGPYIIGFEPADLTPRDRTLVDAAMPDRSAPLRSAVLPRPGSRLELVVPSLPKGAYRFSAVTHLAYRMTGVLVVP